jgi:hypothetical protein
MSQPLELQRSYWSQQHIQGQHEQPRKTVENEKATPTPDQPESRDGNRVRVSGFQQPVSSEFQVQHRPHVSIDPPRDHASRRDRTPKRKNNPKQNSFAKTGHKGHQRYHTPSPKQDCIPSPGNHDVPPSYQYGNPAPSQHGMTATNQSSIPPSHQHGTFRSVQYEIAPYNRYAMHPSQQYTVAPHNQYLVGLSS